MSLHTDKVAAARLWLISEKARDLPYLATALYAQSAVASSQVATVAVDEHWRLYVSPTWLTDTDVPAVAAELAHVTWHLLHDHAARARSMGVDPSTSGAWHRAADAALARTLRDCDLLPAAFPTPAELGCPEGWSAEQYFAKLTGLPTANPTEGEPEPGCGSGCDGLLRSHELPPDVDAPGVDRDEAQQIRRQVAIAYEQHINARGTTPGDAWRWTREILEPTIAWEPLLAAAVRRAAGRTQGQSTYTYRRPSRRASATPGIVLPATERPLPSVALVIDTSGSVDDTLLGQALGEVDGALRALGVSDAQVNVLACDAAVHAVTRVRNAHDARLAGGGGTDMAVGIHAAAALRPRVDLIVVLTDGYTPWPATPPPGAAVVAAILGRRGDPLPPTPGWAQRVECVV